MILFPLFICNIQHGRGVVDTDHVISEICHALGYISGSTAKLCQNAICNIIFHKQAVQIVRPCVIGNVVHERIVDSSKI